MHEQTNLHSLPSQNEKRFGSLGQEPGEFMDEDVLYFVRLFDANADTNTIHTGLN